MPRKIIIDTDPGQDDAVALLLALASPEDLEVLAVVTVAGNVPLSHTTAERPAGAGACPQGRSSALRGMRAADAPAPRHRRARAWADRPRRPEAAAADRCRCSSGTACNI